MEDNKIQNNHSTIRMPILIGISLAFGIFIGATFFGNRGLRSNLNKNSQKFKEILTYIQKSYVDSVNTDSLVDYSITQMLAKLDPHTYYFPPQEAEISRSQLEGGFDGIGIEFNVYKDTLFVISAIPGGPSAIAGLQSGDAIIQANNNNLTGKNATTNTIFSNIRGKKGTSVNLLVKRKNFRNLLKFTIVRDKIPQYSIEAAYLLSDKKTGYIKINRFAETTYDEFVSHAEILKKQGMKQLLLDLRGNPGGYMDKATDIIDELVGGEDVIVYTKGKEIRNNRQTFAGKKGIFERGSVVVMVDEGSASASEIVSGALQDYDRALVVGRRTFGKGLVQQPIVLSDGSELRLTVSRYYIPSGRSIQKPYQKGDLDQYEHELDERSKSGEYFIADSIKNNPKMKFKTKGGRIVYGGGGVTPDIFVARDTSHITPFLLGLYSKNIIRELAVSFANSHKEQWEKQGFDYFLNNFTTNDALLEQLKIMAKNASIPFNEKDFVRSKAFIKLQLKASIARIIWNKQRKDGLNNEFYQIISAEDPIYIKAIQAFGEASKLENLKKTKS